MKSLRIITAIVMMAAIAAVGGIAALSVPAYQEADAAACSAFLDTQTQIITKQNCSSDTSFATSNTFNGIIHNQNRK